MATNEEEKSTLSPRLCTMPQVNHNDSKITLIALQIASVPTLFSRSGPQWLLDISKPQRMIQEKRFGSNGEVISETGAYFEAKDNPFYKKALNS